MSTAGKPLAPLGEDSAFPACACQPRRALRAERLAWEYLRIGGKCHRTERLIGEIPLP